MSALEDDNEFNPIIILMIDGVRHDFTPTEYLAWLESDGGSENNPHNQ